MHKYAPSIILGPYPFFFDLISMAKANLMLSLSLTISFLLLIQYSLTTLAHVQTSSTTSISPYRIGVQSLHEVKLISSDSEKSKMVVQIKQRSGGGASRTIPTGTAAVTPRGRSNSTSSAISEKLSSSGVSLVGLSLYYALLQL